MDTSGHLPWKVRSVRLSSRCPDPRGAGIINRESEFATGLLVPAGTPADIIRFLQAQIAQIAALPDVRERLGTLGLIRSGARQMSSGHGSRQNHKMGTDRSCRKRQYQLTSSLVAHAMRGPRPDRTLEIGYAFWKSKVLLSAVEFDVFTVLAPGPLTLRSTGR